MNEQSIFSEALDIDDASRRATFLDQACGDDADLRKRVNALLEEHERSGEFLDVPALQQIKEAGVATRAMGNNKTTPDEQDEKGEMDFSFLQPTDVPGSLGRLGHYDIREMIGRGGCGIVFKAFDERLHRIVAIKVMTPEMAATSPARKRFLREARATAAIRHENVVSIHAVEESPIPFLVMEYIDGKTLQQLIDETGPLDLQEILRFGQMIAKGLDAAHQKGLIHRDIKPANILIDSGTRQIKITDFGLARAADDASRSQSGVIAGTPLYMSPEQIQGRKLDQRSDLFSLGSVLYVMCSGRPPFRATSILAVLKRVVDEEPRSIQEIIPEVPDWLVAIITKLHAKDPAERYASAQEVANLLAHPLVAIANPANLATDGPSIFSRVSLPNHLWWKAAAILFVFLSSLGVTEATGVTNLHSTVIRLFSPEGTLVVEVDDPGVSISVDGEQLVITGAGAKEIRVKPGQHRVTASKDGEVLLQELVTISRDGRQVVRVSREAMPVAAIGGADPTHRASPLFQAGSIWAGSNIVEIFRGNTENSNYPARLLVIERTGDRFKARFEGAYSSRIVTGTIRQGVLQWSKADVTAEKGSIGFDHVGTITDDRIELRYQGLENNGTESKGVIDLRLVNQGAMPSPQPAQTGLDQLQAMATDPDRRAAEYVLSIGGKVRIDDDHPSPYGTNPEIKSLDDLPDNPFQLTHVVLDRNNRVVDAGLASLRGTKNLRAVFIEFSTNFSNDGLSYLRENRKLQVLNLWGTKITGAGLSHFRDCSDLRDIRLGFTPMTAKDLSVLQSFQKLDKLGCLMLTATGADDSTLALLTTAPHLNQLNIDGTSITDAGLIQLENHRELHTVTLNDTQVTRQGFERLSKALPKCKIDWKESASPESIARSAAFFQDPEWEWSQPEQVKITGIPEHALVVHPFLCEQTGELYCAYSEETVQEMNLAVCQSTGDAKSWLAPEVLPDTVNGPAQEYCPRLFDDGKSMLFYSFREGGFGDHDLWLTQRDALDQPFGEPVNLGPSINTSASESYFAISNDGLTLVFQRNTVGTLYVATRSSLLEPFREPVRLDVEGHASCPALSPDGKKLVFNSSQRGKPELWGTLRDSITEPFGAPVPFGPQWEAGSWKIPTCITGDLSKIYLSFAAEPGQPHRLWVIRRLQSQKQEIIE